MSQEELDQLLWVNSTLAHPAIVLVVDDGYQADLALTLFRMGVDEYISVSDHAARLATVMRHLLAATPTGAPAFRNRPRLAPGRHDPSPPADHAGSQRLRSPEIMHESRRSSPESLGRASGVLGHRPAHQQRSLDRPPPSCPGNSVIRGRRSSRSTRGEPRRRGTGAVDPQRSGPGSHFLKAAKIPGVKLGVAALRRHMLPIDEKRHHGGRGLKDMPSRHDEVGALADFERTDLIGNAEDLCRGQGHGLEGRILGKAERDRRSPPRRGGSGRRLPRRGLRSWTGSRP